MARLVLQFESGPLSPQLVATTYSNPSTGCEYRCVRGKQAPGRKHAGTFQWTNGVKGIALVILKARAACGIDQSGADWIEAGGVSSADYSLIVSADYALTKQPNWLLDMFGVDSRGNSHCRRLFLRCNRDGKLPGPVQIAINPHVLAPSDIKIECGGVELTEPAALLSLMQDIERMRDARSHVKSTAKIAAPRIPMVGKTNLITSAVEVVSEATAEVDALLHVNDKNEKAGFAQRIFEIESALPRLLVHCVSRFLKRALPIQSEPIFTSDAAFIFLSEGPVCIQAGRDREEPEVMVVTLRTKKDRLKRLIEGPLDSEGVCKSLRIEGGDCFSSMAKNLLTHLSECWTQMYTRVRHAVKMQVQDSNPEVVTRLYEILRYHLQTEGVPETVLNAFSLFMHHDGCCRYVLDPERHKAVRSVLQGKEKLTHAPATDFSRLAQTEAWYALAVLNSKDTMSFTEAILPGQPWCGTPDIWKKPIPGFGASEMAVYGMGRTWAEPVRLGVGPDSLALCAVFSDERRQYLSTKFVGLPEPMQQICQMCIDELRAIKG